MVHREFAGAKVVGLLAFVIVMAVVGGRTDLGLLRLEFEADTLLAVFFDFVETGFDGVEELVFWNGGVWTFLELRRKWK
jgi:hypothetical protein